MTLFCPRGPGPDSPFRAPMNGEMEWRDGRCSYCGSVSEEDFFKAVEAGSEIVPTDKSYKVYVPGGKFYFQHLSQDGQQKFIDLLNAGRVNVGAPGHFYVLPFFVKRES